MLVTQSCPALCDCMDCNSPGSSVHGTLQARILECVAILFSRGISQPRDRTWVSCIAGRNLYHLSHQGCHFVYPEFKFWRQASHDQESERQCEEHWDTDVGTRCPGLQSCHQYLLSQQLALGVFT